jgi:hypothetical protein
MINHNQRVVVMAEEESPPPAWYLNAWDYAQENFYLMKTPDDFSCAPNRGDTENPLFLLNHWIDRVSPSNLASLSILSGRDTVIDGVPAILYEPQPLFTLLPGTTCIHPF